MIIFSFIFCSLDLFSEWNNGLVLHRRKIITDAIFNFIDTQLHLVYDGYDVGRIPPTPYLVFISND